MIIKIINCNENEPESIKDFEYEIPLTPLLWPMRTPLTLLVILLQMTILLSIEQEANNSSSSIAIKSVTKSLCLEILNKGIEPSSSQPYTTLLDAKEQSVFAFAE
jgi:hypothetical protein